MPSVHRMANLITSFGFVYKTFQNTFAVHDRAPVTLQTLSALFHPELQLGESHLLPSDLNASVSPSKWFTLTCHMRGRPSFVKVTFRSVKTGVPGLLVQSIRDALMLGWTMR